MQGRWGAPAPPCAPNVCAMQLLRLTSNTKDVFNAQVIFETF